jgi:hypothetical protein
VWCQVSDPKKMPWWSYIDLQTSDPLGLLRLASSIPKEWLFKPLKPIHCTVLLNTNSVDDAVALQRVAGVTPPFEIRTAELGFSRVDRIKDDEVYAIFVLLTSPALRVFRDAFASQRGIAHLPDVFRTYDPYGGEGHITLAYIRAEHADAAKEFVAQKRSDLPDAAFLVKEIVHSAGREKHLIRLACAPSL